jgi:hypothetical protein
VGRLLGIRTSEEGGPFDLIDGLPVHPLVVHGAVVLVPLTALGLLLMAVWPGFSRRHGWLVVGLAVAATGATVVSVRSGEALEERVGEPGFDHAELGEVMPWLAGGLLATTLVLWLVDRAAGRGSPAAPAEAPSAAPPRPAGRLLRAAVAVVAVLVAVANLAWIYRVGHSGAQSVWLGRVGAQAAVADDDAEVPAATFTVAQVAQRDGPGACWTAVSGVVYDLTEWIERHPGGTAPIESLCGRDGSALFEAQHAGHAQPAEELAEHAIGRLA